MNTVYVKSVKPDRVNEAEVIRYMRCSNANDEILKLLRECESEASDLFDYKVCFCQLSLAIGRNCCDFGVFSTTSSDLSRRLNGCTEAIVFAATVGVGIDRLVAKYAQISPSRTLMFQALGAERVEALCDKICELFPTEFGCPVTARFSPGYGDLELSLQKSIFSVLGCEKRIGLTLNDNLMMLPTKSVTAFVGLKREEIYDV